MAAPLHSNQEDLLGPDEWQPFLARYLHSRGAGAHFGQRLRGYLALFPVFWLGLLLDEGMRPALDPSLAQSNVPDLELF